MGRNEVLEEDTIFLPPNKNESLDADENTLSIVISIDSDIEFNDDVSANPLYNEAVYCCSEPLTIPLGIFVKFTFQSAPLPLATIVSNR